MTERENLLRKIQICDFALNDAALFLDINPGDEMALNYYKNYLNMRAELVSAYTKRFGPLSRSDYDGGSRWSWVENPWPWHNEEA